MTNEEKAKETRIVMTNTDKAKSLFYKYNGAKIDGQSLSQSSVAFQSSLEMAEWKDKQSEKRDELIILWFSSIKQMAFDRKTANGKVMDFQSCLDEIRTLAKEAQEYLMYN